MIAATFPILINKGATFGPLIFGFLDGATINPLDLTGWTPHAQVRLGAGKPVILNLDPTIPNPTDGRVVITFTDEQTAVMPHGVFQWDLLMERPNGEILGPYFAGVCTIMAGITKV